MFRLHVVVIGDAFDVGGLILHLIQVFINDIEHKVEPITLIFHDFLLNKFNQSPELCRGSIEESPKI